MQWFVEVCSFAYVFISPVDGLAFINFASNRNSCLSQKASRYSSWTCSTYSYYTTESNKQYWLFLIIFEWPWLLCSNFSNLCCLSSIQEAFGLVIWLLRTLCLLKNEIYIGCIPKVNIMTSFTLSKGQPCQTHSSQYPTAHPFSTGAQPRLGLQSAGTQMHRSDKDK